jgi:hypothetical protein
VLRPGNTEPGFTLLREEGRPLIEERFTQESLKVLAGEAPGERLVQGGIATAELNNAVLQLVQAGAVVRSEHFALDDREVDLDQVNANAID